MKVLIIGASGLVGGNCLRYFKEKKELEVVGTHMSFQTDDTVYLNTIDISDAKNFDINGFDPDVIIHMGALTNVDYCEENEEESYTKTVSTGKTVVELCKKHNARLVYTSTDYVFDGTHGPYTEDASVNPLSVYARHKLEIEQFILNELPESVVIRITNVYGDEIRGKNFIARILDSIKKREEMNMRLPSDQYATPVNSWDVARAIYELLSNNKSGIYHIASTDFMNRVQLAQKVLSYFPEAKANINGIVTSELKQAADRPLTGGLLALKFLSEFPDFRFSNVDDYLQQYKAGKTVNGGRAS